MENGQGRQPLTVEIDVDLDRALDAVADAADDWGAEWHRLGTGGRLMLPIAAGLRHGLVDGEISSQRLGSATQLDYSVEQTEYVLNRGAVMVLLFGGLGAICIIVAPLYPPLLGLAGPGFLLMLVAWFLVSSKVRNRSAGDFLQLVADIASQPPPESGASELVEGELANRTPGRAGE